jgi:hypothetical protein
MAFNLSSEWPMAATIRGIFTEEIEAAGGTVSDAIESEGWSFLRSVLPATSDVQPGDKLRAGVALRASEQELWVHPYVFRKVCSNGAIFAQAIQSRHVTDLDVLPSDEAEVLIREAVQSCCVSEAFEGAVAGMRAAIGQTAEEHLALRTVSLLINLTRFPGPRGTQADRELLRTVMDIADRFRRQEDRSRYALLNAVTATARDTRAPAVRWRLEELGGALAAIPAPRGPLRPERAAIEETILV